MFYSAATIGVSVQYKVLDSSIANEKNSIEFNFGEHCHADLLPLTNNKPSSQV